MLLFLPSSDYIDLNIHIEKIKNIPPYKIRRWQDEQSSARGILVINSFHKGYARGFIRVSDSLSLSKATEEARLTSKMIESSGYGGACACLVGNIEDRKVEETKERFLRTVSKEFKLTLKSNGEFLIANSKTSIMSLRISRFVARIFNGSSSLPYV